MNPSSRKKILILLALVFTIFLMMFPIRILLAEFYYGRVEALLDDPETENVDMIAISTDSMPAYEEAIALLRRSTVLVGSDPIYRSALSEVYARLGSWAEAMDAASESARYGSIGSRDAYRDAVLQLRHAISVEPLNPDYHFTLSRLYLKQRERALFEAEVASAVAASPANTSIRYAAARTYLLIGNNEKALEQAKQLAAMDDGYVITDSAVKELTLQRRPPEYLSRLAQSYLFKALEIAWRASNKDLRTLKSIVPDNSDAKQALGLFLEAKGIEE